MYLFIDNFGCPPTSQHGFTFRRVMLFMGGEDVGYIMFWVDIRPQLKRGLGMCECNATFVETALTNRKRGGLDYVVIGFYAPTGERMTSYDAIFKGTAGDDLCIRCTRCGHEPTDYDRFYK